MVRYCSLFWVRYAAGVVELSPIWADRDLDMGPPAGVNDDPAHPSEVLDMGAWLRMKEAERAAIVGDYAPGRRLALRFKNGTERRQQEAA
jgi:hypothetical protein